MQIAVLILVYLFALILSNIVNRLFPKIPLPMVQIIFGAVISLVTHSELIEFETEYFLAFIIAPLLFREGEESDITNVLRHWKLIVYLIFPVVFVSAISIGYVTHTFSHIELPLAACFALGAALGPTDLVAFNSLSKRFSFPKHIKNILQGEGLMNDASGLVSFQVAITALVTGAFSLGQASANLLISLFGGFLIGFVVIGLNRLLLAILDNVDAADVRGGLLIELALPILAYFLAEEIHVSGIIAVVVAGISQASRFKRITLFDAQLDQVTDTVWRTISFILNGLVFIFLGSELAILGEPVLESAEISTLSILLLIVLVTIILFGTRFVMLSAFYAIQSRRRRRPFKRYLKEIMILTFSGVKGTVSIATILLLPVLSSTQYSVLLFIVAGTTFLSFLTGVVVLPHLANPKQAEAPAYVTIGILTEVVEQLQHDVDTDEDADKTSLYALIDSYNQRIENMIIDQESNEVKSELAYIRVMILGIESDGLEHALSAGEIDMAEYRAYQRYLRTLERQINRNFISSLSYIMTVALRAIPSVVHEILTFGSSIRRFFKERRDQSWRLTDEGRKRLQKLYLDNSELIIEALDQLDGVYNSELIAYLKRERQAEIHTVHSGSFSERILARLMPVHKETALRGFYLERKVIAEYEARELITRRYAKSLRREVNQLETYALKEEANTLPYDIVNYGRERL